MTQHSGTHGTQAGIQKGVVQTRPQVKGIRGRFWDDSVEGNAVPCGLEEVGETFWMGFQGNVASLCCNFAHLDSFANIATGSITYTKSTTCYQV